MKNINKSYLLCNFARSFDQPHILNNNYHLLSSVFYTQSISFNNLKFFNNKRNIIIILYFNTNMESKHFNIICNTKELLLIKFDFLYFLGLSDLNNSKTDEFLKQNYGFILNILNSEDLIKTDFNYNKFNYKIKDILFVFEDLDWFTVQLFFKTANIIISGGTISKRYMFSTTQYNLSKYLMCLNYTDEDIYNSYKHLHRLNSNNYYKKINTEFNKSLILKIIKTELNTNLINLNNSIKKLEKDISDKLNEINTLEKNYSILINEINKQENLITNSNKLKILNKETNENKLLIENKQKEIINLNVKISKIESEKENLDTLSYNDLKSNFLKNFYNIKYKKDLSIFNLGISN